MVLVNELREQLFSDATASWIFFQPKTRGLVKLVGCCYWGILKKRCELNTQKHIDNILVVLVKRLILIGLVYIFSPQKFWRNRPTKVVDDLLQGELSNGALRSKNTRIESPKDGLDTF